MLAHYLPRCYLEAFTAGERLHVFDRETGKLRRDSPRNVAAITDYYILTNASGEREEHIEHGLLADLESAAAPVLRRLANCDPISDREHDVVATFLAFLCTRIPAFEETYAELNNQLGQEFFRRAAATPERAAKFVAAHPQSFPYSAEDFCAFVNSDALSFPPDQRRRIQLMIELAEPLIAGFKGMDWWLWRAQGKRRFITSDAPFGLLPLPGALPTYGELSPHVLRFVSLSPDVCLMLADRQRESPFLTAKDLDEDGVRDVNAAIAFAAVRLVVARDRDELETVLGETALRTSAFRPRTKVVNWNDSVDERSFGLDVRLHHNTHFPVALPIEWTCQNCAARITDRFVVAADLTPANPHAYAEWLDRPCPGCGRPPRRTRSTLANHELAHLALPPDVSSTPRSSQ
jgi:hypothetical protein